MNNKFTIEAILKASGADQFSKDFQNATKSMDRIGRASKKSSGGLKTFMGGMGKIAGAIGITKAISAGFSAIKNSVGDAVSRVDTLNQFPKMMKAIGFSSEDAESAVEQLSDGIQGLPTKLDDVTSTAQNIAIMTGDLDGATETTLALNNAFLASGSDSADAARGLQQYTQMLSRGEVDMQSWRTLQETMGVALNDTAEAFGFAGESAQNDLYDALQDGTITFDEFNDKIVELDEGVGGFAERALIGSEGIATSMQNIKTAIGTGIADAITAVDEAMQAGGFGSISENLDKVKGKVQEAFKAITAAVGPTVEFIIGVVDAFQEMKERIITAFEEMFPNFDLFKNQIQLVWENIKEAFSLGNMDLVGENFSYMFSLIFQKIQEAIPLVLEKALEIMDNLVSGITQKIPEWYEKGYEIMTTLFGVLADAIPKLLILGMEFVTELIKGIGNKLPDWISKGVEMVVKMAKTIGDNLPKILAKGVEMLGSLAKGFRDNFPAMVSAAFDMIAKLLGSILENLPRLLAAGVELIAKLAVGLVKAIPKVLRAMRDITSGIKDAVSNISLLDAGKAIIGGFVRGLKGAWKGGKKFIGGIGGWIAKNKGPISYDKKLLINAGEAIIGGLNKGLQDSFPGVQKTVKGIAGAINETMTGGPTVDISGSVAKSNAGVSRVISHELNNNMSTQPAYINLNIGGQDWRGFVENVSNEQGRITDLELQF